MLKLKSLDHNWQVFTYHVNSVVAYSIILSELLVSNLIFEEKLGWVCVCVEVLFFVRRNFFLILESVIANYAGGRKQMNYDLLDVTVYGVVVEWTSVLWKGVFGGLLEILVLVKVEICSTLRHGHIFHILCNSQRSWWYSISLELLWFCCPIVFCFVMHWVVFLSPFSSEDVRNCCSNVIIL